MGRLLGRHLGQLLLHAQRNRGSQRRDRNQRPADLQGGVSDQFVVPARNRRRLPEPVGDRQRAGRLRQPRQPAPRLREIRQPEQRQHHRRQRPRHRRQHDTSVRLRLQPQLRMEGLRRRSAVPGRRRRVGLPVEQHGLRPLQRRRSDQTMGEGFVERHQPQYRISAADDLPRSGRELPEFDAMASGRLLPASEKHPTELHFSQAARRTHRYQGLAGLRQRPEPRHLLGLQYLGPRNFDLAGQLVLLPDPENHQLRHQPHPIPDLTKPDQP